MNGISVIICCYNSASRLPLTLEYLSKQNSGSDLNWEIIIVNNNSIDNTVDKALECWKSLSCKQELRIVNEARAGLSYARQTGVSTALYDIIIFCDDDNLLAENYLQYGYELVQKTKHFGYGVWGGNSAAYFNKEVVVPAWFEQEKANYVVGVQGNKTGDVSNRGYLWGAGMITFRNLFRYLINDRYPLILTGRTGNSLLSGDDSEYCLRCLILGYKLYYDEGLKFMHYIPGNKLTREYNEGLKKGFEQAHAFLNKYYIFIHYVAGRGFVSRNYYAFILFVKYVLGKIQWRTLTELDRTAIQASFHTKKFRDFDFQLMRSLLKMRKTVDQKDIVVE